MKSRIHYIDRIKTLAIFLVIYCHFPVAGGSLMANVTLQFATVTGVPLFFMVNGALLLSENRFDFRKHIRRTSSLLVVSMVWKALYYLCMLAMDKAVYAQVTVQQIAYYLCGGNLEDPYVPAEHFWFIYALIGIYLIFPMIRTVYDSNEKILKYLVVLLFFYVFVLTEYSNLVHLLSGWFNVSLIDGWPFRNATFPFAQGGDYLLYFILGGILHENYYSGHKDMKDRRILMVTGVTGFLILLVQKYLQEGSLHGDWVTLANDYQRMGTLILTTSLFLFTMYVFKNETAVSQRVKDAFAFVSKRTMNIYVIHMMFCALFLWKVQPMLSRYSVLYHIFRTIIILAVSIIVMEPFTWLPGATFVLGLSPAHSQRKKQES